MNLLVKITAEAVTASTTALKMFEELSRVIKKLEEMCIDDAYFEIHTVHFDMLACAEAFASVVTRQHREWCERNAQECAIDALENRLMGYTR